MSIKNMISTEKTNAHRISKWEITENPFPAFRGKGSSHMAFFPFKNIVREDQHSKIITTKKGTKLIVPCDEKEDQKIILISISGGFRGYFSRIIPINGNIIYKKESNKHCVPSSHIVFIAFDNDSHLIAESGRRCGHGYIDYFSWNGYKFMSTEEYQAMIDIFHADI